MIIFNLNVMNRLLVSATIACLFFSLLISPICHAASPSDGDLQRFLVAYPVGDLFEAGFRARVQLAASKSTKMQKEAACALNKYDRSLIEKRAFTEARIQFKDILLLSSITMTLETPAGRKLVSSLLRIFPSSIQAPTIPDAGFTPSEDAVFRRFQGTIEGAVFQNFAQTVGPKIAEDPAYIAMMNGIKSECFKEPVYAIYGVELQGEHGIVKTINVGTLPSGILSDCKNQINVYEAAIHRTNQNGAARIIPSSCAYVLPADLQPLLRSEKLPDAYVLKQSGNWAPIYTAWYGLSTAKSSEMCAQLIGGMRRVLTADRVDIQCFAPSEAKKKKK
jgi:hypothetical protein